LRKHLGLSGEDAARALGVGASWLSSGEQQDRSFAGCERFLRPWSSTIQRRCYPLKDLLAEKDDKKPHRFSLTTRTILAKQAALACGRFSVDPTSLDVDLSTPPTRSTDARRPSRRSHAWGHHPDFCIRRAPRAIPAIASPAQPPRHRPCPGRAAAIPPRPRSGRGRREAGG